MTSHSAKDKLIVALDVETFEEARDLVEKFSDLVDIYKIGSQLFTACGPTAVRHLLVMNKKVFLDLKFHDIPNTVASAVNAAAAIHCRIASDANPISSQGIFMYTVHTQGGRPMMEAAVEAATQKAKLLGIPKPLGVGVTVLTSEEKKDNITALVLERALLAKQSGLDGVISSPWEAQMIRKELGKDFVIVTPGIRFPDSDAGDQQRVATAFEAISQGSNYLVVGRPIVKATDPRKAAEEMLKDISSVQSN